MEARHVAIDAERRRRARRGGQAKEVGLVRAFSQHIRVVCDRLHQLLANLADGHLDVVLDRDPKAMKLLVAQLDNIVGRHFPAVLLGEAAPVPLGLQLVDVNGDAAHAEKLDAVHSEVLLGLVHEADNHVVIVGGLLRKTDVEDAHLGLRGPIEGQWDEGVRDPFVGADLVIVALAVSIFLGGRRLEFIGNVQVEAAEAAPDEASAEAVHAARC